MATTNTQAAKPVQTASQLDVIGQLAQLIGGTNQTQTVSPGNTASLQALLTQLQGADYSSLLQNVFQQAAGQIPGIQVAMGNAMGARGSAGNSAVQIALSNLMKQAALEGQKQIADQQLANQQIQANVGGNIAQATRGTTQTTSTPGGLGDITKLIALAKLGTVLTGESTVEGMFGKLTGVKDSQGAGATTTAETAAPAAVFGQLSPTFGNAFMMPATTMTESVPMADMTTGFDYVPVEDFMAFSPDMFGMNTGYGMDTAGMGNAFDFGLDMGGGDGSAFTDDLAQLFGL